MIFRRKNPKHKVLNKLLLVFLVLYTIIEITLYADSHNYLDIPGIIIRGLNFMVTAFFALLIATVLVRLTINRILDFFAEDISIEQKIFFSKVYSWFVYFVAIGYILYKLGISLDNITIFLGLATTGFAFALRDVILSYFVWVAVLTKKPFTIDDFVRIGDEEGRVEKIGTFFLTLDKSLGAAKDSVKVPNKILLDKPIVNYGKGDIIETIKIKLVSLPADINRKLKAVSKIVKGAIGKGHEQSVNIEDIEGDIYLNISFSIHYQDRKESRTEIVKKIYPLIKGSMPKDK